VKPVVIRLAALALSTALIVVALIWISPAIGTHNSSCDRYPYSSNCR
jgi:hypothetical protein